MRSIPVAVGEITLLLVSIIYLSPIETAGIQLDYLGSENITSQTWRIEFTIPAMGEDRFNVRLPFPNYSYIGRWASYTTHEVSAGAIGLCGPILYELHHYNQGYSNQGVWLEITYPCNENRVGLTVTQSAKLNLPGIDYPLTFHTNNPWMDGSDIVDAYSPVVENVLSEALALNGDWHSRGGRSVPEKIVNWMNENMSWSGSYELGYPRPASQTLTLREGHCEEWAHAACALLIRAGIPAKVVMVGTLPTYNSTQFRFDIPEWHLCLAYWDGFGWILIDPLFSSGFGIPNRAILGADRDSRNLKLLTYPESLIDYIEDVDFSCDSGFYSGNLSLVNSRCLQYSAEILEHMEFSAGSSTPGFEPISNIIPNIPTEADIDLPVHSASGLSNHPNPFNPVTVFTFTVNRSGRVTIDLYSVGGRHVERICSRHFNKGIQEIAWNSTSIPSGVYFARMNTPMECETRKVVILR